MFKILKKLNKNEKGFTIFEVTLTLFLVSVSLLTLFGVINQINKTDKLAKEANFAEQLIDIYVSYYSNLEITSDDVTFYLSDVGEVDLVKNALKSDSNMIDNTNVFKNLEVICSNQPSLVKHDSQNYLLFNITCEKDGKKISKGNGYQILKYIN